MAKIKKAWFCTACGNESAKWMGKCPACGEWNTMVEEIVSKADEAVATSRNRAFIESSNPTPLPLSQISSSNENRITLSNSAPENPEPKNSELRNSELRNSELKNSELDRVLGGGLVEGSLVLIGGEPGIGKSTLSLQIPLYCKHLKTLYVSGEESARQLKLRADRLASGMASTAAASGIATVPSTAAVSGTNSAASAGSASDNCLILSETLLENILNQAKQVKPQLLIIDSIQTIYSQNIESSAGSVSQVRECAASLLRFAKESNTPVILIGHITKDGSIAGPKVLEHIVDVVLQFEGDTRHSYRILRSIKNRFGSTAELAVYEMTSQGLKEILNPSEMFIPMHENNLSGTAVAAMLDGTRPFLIEIQALVSTAAYGTPQRSATGFDVRRMNMLLAVLEKRVGFKLAQKDVFLNMAGGLKVSDPACDLAVVASILSSNFDVPLANDITFAGEIGLSGEIRPVSQIERRITEAAKLGFRQIFVSSYSKIPSGLKNTQAGHNKTQAGHNNEIQIIEVANIQQLVKAIF